MLACEIVGLTPVQLGALCGVKAWEMRAFLKRDSIPIPVCLHFMLIEQWFREVVLGAKGDCKTLTIPVHLIGRVNTLSKALVKARMIDIRRRREEVRLRAVQRRRDRLALKAAEPPAPPPPVKLQKPPKLMYDPSRVMKPRILHPKTHAFSFAQDSQHD